MSRAGRPSFFAFAVLSLLGGLSFGLIRVTTALYALDLDASTAEQGLIAAAQNVGLLLMALPVGWLVETRGARWSFVFGSLVAGLVLIAVPLVRAPSFLMACSGALGFLIPFRFVAVNAEFMEQLSGLGEHRAGWARGSSLIGMLLIGPGLAVAIVAWLGFAALWYVIAATLGVSVFIAPFAFGRRAGPARAPRCSPSSDISREIRRLAHDPELRETCLVEFAMQSVIAFFGFFVIPLAVESLAFSATAAAHLITIEGAFFIGALFLLGRASTRQAPQRLYLFALPVAGLALFGFGLGATHAGAWTASALLGFSLGTLQLVNLGRFSRIGGLLGRGRIAGVISLIGPAGGLLGCLVGGWLGAWFGLRAVFVLFALGMMSGAAFIGLRVGPADRAPLEGESDVAAG